MSILGWFIYVLIAALVFGVTFGILYDEMNGSRLCALCLLCAMWPVFIMIIIGMSISDWLSGVLDR